MPASTRLMVATLRPTTAAMRRIGMRARRSCSMRAVNSASTVLRVFKGRELRSGKPARPSCSKRARHLRAVRTLMPAASAAGISPITAMRSISNLRPSKVVLAFLWLFIRGDSSESSEAW